MSKIKIEKSRTDKLKGLIEDHIKSLAYPFDSWLEEQMLKADIYSIITNNELIGYCAKNNNELKFFYVRKKAFAFAPAILEQAVSELGIDKIFVMSQDSSMCALIVEWDYEMERVACWFADSGKKAAKAAKVQNAVFRKANYEDCINIRAMAEDFFDEESCGYSSLEERIAEDTIFVLEEGNELLGAGIIEAGRLCKDCISIGMFTNSVHRQKGVAKTVLLNLKDYVYSKAKKPVAGCWYYNTLSRKSLESAGMIAASLGYYAKLIKKDKPPKRTGNPPGELVD